MDGNSVESEDIQQTTASNPLEKQVSRRQLLEVALGALGTMIGLWKLDELSKPANPLPQNQPDVPTPEPISTSETPKTPKFLHEINLTPEELATLNQIPALKLQTQERLQQEKAFTEYATTLDQIDGALQVVADLNCRHKLVEKRFKLRQEADETKRDKRLYKLTPEMIDWAKMTNIDPEALGLALDALPYALQIKQNLWEKKGKDIFKGGFIHTKLANLLPKNFLQKIGNSEALNPGVIAALLMFESSCLRNIGTFPVLSQTNLEKNAFSDSEQILDELIGLLETTGLKLKKENLPGSTWTRPGNLSGGAVSVGFMPKSIKEVNDFLAKELGIVLNPFDPISSVVMVYVFLAMNPGLENWNPNDTQINAIHTVGKSYTQRFTEKK